MPLYFAYGSNMDDAAMAQRCSRSQVIGPAVLHRHRIVIMQEGYASVVRDPRGQVYGLLWDIALADMRALDTYESIGSGLYSKATQRVKRISDDAVRPLVQALVYFGRGNGGGVPLPGYLDNVVANAQRLQFPAAYISQLQRLGAGSMRQTLQSPARPQRKLAQMGERDSDGNIIVRPRYNSPMDR